MFIHLSCDVNFTVCTTRKYKSKQRTKFALNKNNKMLKLRKDLCGILPSTMFKLIIKNVIKIIKGNK